MGNKLNLMGFTGAALMYNDNSPEAKKIQAYDFLNDDFELIFLNPKDKLPEGYFPSGSVEWCLKLLGHHVKPDYYPLWIRPYLNREIWETNRWPLTKKVFIKPSDKYKRFDGRCTTGFNYKGKKKGPYWCSEIVSFIDEWRYYIADGKVLCGHWYAGEGINQETPPKAPDISSISIPGDWCGCLDFGRLSTGQFALVEAQHPFACGWYGDEVEPYMQWLIAGWRYMRTYGKIFNQKGEQKSWET